MLRNLLNTLNNDNVMLANHMHVRAINLNAYIDCCGDLCCWSTPGTVGYIRLICVLYDGLGHTLQAVSGLLLGLHKAACVLLYRKPVTINEVSLLLPDLVKDIMKSPKNTCCAGPDIVPTTFSRNLTSRSSSTQHSNLTSRSSSTQHSNLTSRSSSRPTQHSNFLITARSNHKRLKYNSVYCDVCSSHQHNNTRNDPCHNWDNHIVDDIFRHRKKGIGFTDNNDDHSTTTNEGVHPQNNTRSRKTLKNPYLNYRQSDHKSHRKFHISRAHSSNGRSHEINNRDQTCMVPDATQILPSPRSHPRNLIRPQDIIREIETHGHDQPAALTVDCELTRDIVRAIRSVGDNLEARMRFNNEPSCQAMFGALMIRASWLKLTSLKQYNAVVVISSLSLELLRQFARL